MVNYTSKKAHNKSIMKSSLYTANPDAWVAVKHDAFAVFFPQDAHMPLISDALIHKVVERWRRKTMKLSDR